MSHHTLLMENFIWISRRIVTSMKELAPSEIKQWKAYLEKTRLFLNNYDDFFSENNEEEDGFNDEIYIELWEWKSPEGLIRLTDIFGWHRPLRGAGCKGDNQDGAIFLDDSPEVIATNTDTGLTKVEDSTVSRLAEALHDQLDEFQHVRECLWVHDGCEDKHEHCIQQKERSDED